MKIARCESEKGQFWGLVNVDSQSVQPFEGSFADWAPALTRAINSGEAEKGMQALVKVGAPSR